MKTFTIQKQFPHYLRNDLELCGWKYVPSSKHFTGFVWMSTEVQVDEEEATGKLVLAWFVCFGIVCVGMLVWMIIETLRR